MILWQVARLESIEMYHQPVVAPTIPVIWGYYLDAVCYIRQNFHHPIRPPPWPVKFSCFSSGDCL